MTVEVLLLGVMVGITLLGYMIAVNSHGSTRLSMSYFLATILLAGTVWAIVQYVNEGTDRKQRIKYNKLEQEKLQAEARVQTQEQILLRNKKMMQAASKLNAVVSEGTGYASAMMNVDLKDFSVELDVLVARANAMKSKVTALNNEYNSIKKEASYFPEGAAQIEDGIAFLLEAAKYYKWYFRAEDSVQEELRDRMMRQKARAAYNAFKQAAGKITVN